MTIDRNRPGDLVQRVVKRRQTRSHGADAWRREAFRLPRLEARALARAWFERYPRAAYMTEIEFWRECADGQIEFVMRRLPVAD